MSAGRAPPGGAVQDCGFPKWAGAAAGTAAPGDSGRQPANCCHSATKMPTAQARPTATAKKPKT